MRFVPAETRFWGFRGCGIYSPPPHIWAHAVVGREPLEGPKAWDFVGAKISEVGQIIRKVKRK